MTGRTQFDDPALARALADRIAERAGDTPRVVMEVCGTHTQAVGRWGLRDLLPPTLRLVSGPGCPVCVTPASYIDRAAELALDHDAVIATFGDLVRVPGDETSLERARGEGADVRVVYSAADALSIARETDRQVVFLAVGFETTVAGIAAAVTAAKASRVTNLSFFCAFKQVPPALVALLDDPEVRLDGFLLPGHVSAVIGLEPYRVLTERKTPGVVAGFEPVDILHALAELIDLVEAGRGEVRNCYRRAVRDDGNAAAKRMMESTLVPVDAVWRGIGVIPDSGLALAEEFADFDAARRFDLDPLVESPPTGCRCGDVLRGVVMPEECPLFGAACTPDHPVGPCMVSGEGSCAARHAYG